MKYRPLLYCLSALAFAFAALSWAHGRDVLGAEGILESLAESGSPGAAGAEESAFERTGREIAALPPAEAAERWLNAYRQTLREGPVYSRSAARGEENWIAILPQPEAWPHLREATEERVAAEEAPLLLDLHLQLLAEVLAGDEEAQWATYGRIEVAMERGGASSGGGAGDLIRRAWGSGGTDDLGQQRRFLRRINEQMVELSGDPDRIVEALLRRVETGAEDSYGMGPEALNVPDLVTLVGEEEAEALLRRFFVEYEGPLEVRSGEETRALARRLAVELVDELSAAPWGLASHLDGAELFEELRDRFSGAPGARDYERVTAQRYYLLSLVLEGRTNDAVEVAREIAERGERFSLPWSVRGISGEGPRGLALYDFFERILDENPELPFWQQYITLGIAVGRASSVIDALERLLDEHAGEAESLREVRLNLVTAYFAADRVEEGVTLLRRMAEPSLRGGGEAVSDAELARVGANLARIGHLMDRDDWRDEGIEIVGRTLPAGTDWTAAGVRNDTAGLLIELERYEEAEAMLQQSLRSVVGELQADGGSWRLREARRPLIDLAALYYRMERYDDILHLLDRAPWWGERDLVSFVAESGGVQPDLVIGYLAAKALAENGERARAIALLREVLWEEGGYDPAYQLLVRLQGMDAIPWLDELYAIDPFEERPLIWKARLLKDRGELEEAAFWIERAIEIDPSDGEQGPGYRMRAYRVLSEILIDKGDFEEAEFYADIVRAIRMSEEADRFYNAGLLRRGVDMYRDSLDYFADAYCIQSRLAIQLAEVGEFEQAEEHYRRAYELMPDSFGRVESHCFGCEGAFDGARAQSVAEQVFERLIEERPDQPQVYYLMGYLRREQGNYIEAFDMFREAVDRDPRYLNAWTQIASMGRRYHLDRDLRDMATLTLLELDPLGRHSSPDLRRVTDLAAMWEAVDEARGKRRIAPESLYSLPSSAAFLGERQSDPYQYYMTSYEANGDGLSPGQALARHGLLSAVNDSLEAAARSGR